jgi:endonuclease YncB( thermonuclease family)
MSIDDLRVATYENTPTFGVLDGYSTPCKALRIHDGDTLWIAFRTAHTILNKIKIRMDGYDSAELHSTTETNLAKNATETLQKLIDQAGDKLSVKFLHVDKYGRTLAQLFDDNRHVCLNTEMVQLGMGVVYSGGKKPILH